MKKMLAMMALCLTIAPAALAEVDLTGMSFDELVSLQAQLTAEAMSRPEWKEVEVPVGTYTVGQDIPAGTYSLKIKAGGMMASIQINGYETSHVLTEGDMVGKIDLKDGDQVDITISAVVFMPYAGLGF